MEQGSGSQQPATSPNNDSADSDDNHPIAETWLGILLFWSGFVVPPVFSLVFIVAGIGSFPPVRRWGASTFGDVPYALQVGIAIVYFITIPVALGVVWWTSYQSRPLIGEATLISLVMLGIMGAIAVVGVFLGRGFRSLT